MLTATVGVKWLLLLRKRLPVSGPNAWPRLSWRWLSAFRVKAPLPALLRQRVRSWCVREKRVSSISPVAIRMTWTALPITSAGRFSPLGPLGTTALRQVLRIREGFD